MIDRTDSRRAGMLVSALPIGRLSLVGKLLLAGASAWLRSSTACTQARALGSRASLVTWKIAVV